MSLCDGNNDDNGLVMRLFGIAVFVVDGPVMAVFLLQKMWLWWSCKIFVNWFWWHRWS